MRQSSDLPRSTRDCVSDEVETNEFVHAKTRSHRTTSSSAEGPTAHPRDRGMILQYVHEQE